LLAAAEGVDLLLATPPRISCSKSAGGVGFDDVVSVLLLLLVVVVLAELLVVSGGGGGGGGGVTDMLSRNDPKSSDDDEVGFLAMATAGITSDTRLSLPVSASKNDVAADDAPVCTDAAPPPACDDELLAPLLPALLAAVVAPNENMSSVNDDGSEPSLVTDD
jgi:hypothetical protein